MQFINTESWYLYLVYSQVFPKYKTNNQIFALHCVYSDAIELVCY